MRLSCSAFDDTSWDITEKRDQTKKTSEEIPDAKALKALHGLVDQYIDADNDDQPYTLPIFSYYGTGRGVFDVPKGSNKNQKHSHRFNAFNGSLEARANFKRFMKYFYDLEVQELRLKTEKRSFDVELPKLKVIREAISSMLPDFSKLRSVPPKNNGLMIDWKHDDVQKTLRIEQLSDGFRTTLAMVMDIASRMVEANPDSDEPLNTDGIILIDEIDLHLHPSWQQSILLDLQRTFPNIQWIVTTHSPQVASTVKSSSLRLINWCDGQPLLNYVQFSLGAEFQHVLEDVLGVKESRAENLDIVKDLRRYQHLVEKGEWQSEEALTLRKILDEWGAENEPELLSLDMDIRLQKLDAQT